jgi:hypothetical protein
MKNGYCSKHGKPVRFYARYNHEKQKSQGGFYGCPLYGECGQYYCEDTNSMKTSKRFGGEG